MCIVSLTNAFLCRDLFLTAAKVSRVPFKTTRAASCFAFSQNSPFFDDAKAFRACVCCFTKKRKEQRERKKKNRSEKKMIP